MRKRSKNEIAVKALSPKGFRHSALPQLKRNGRAVDRVPTQTVEALLDEIEDIALNAIADSRANQRIIKLTLDSL